VLSLRASYDPAELDAEASCGEIGVGPAGRKEPDVTPIIVAAVVAVVIVVGVFLVMMTRSRRDDEGERFRRVADLTSRWSRQVQAAPEESGVPSKAEPRPEMAQPRAGNTESVDPS
jgi:hypothetical protein